jgi:ribosome-binding factor A
MKTHRPLRVGSVIREELAKILLKEVDFPLGAIVTITDVVVDSRMDWSDILVSVIPGEKADEALKVLHRATGHLHHVLIRKMNIRPMPRIRFKLDPGPEKAAIVEKILLEEGV